MVVFLFLREHASILPLGDTTLNAADILFLFGNTDLVQFWCSGLHPTTNLCEW